MMAKISKTAFFLVLLLFLSFPGMGLTEEISKDDRFVANSNGTVLDKESGLMWAVKDNGEDVNWQGAKRYCERYRGGGYTDWRMPTLEELAGLYDQTKTYKSACGDDVHLTELIRLTCCCSWTSEKRGSNAAYIFGFTGGSRAWVRRSLIKFTRILPVRSAK